MRQRAAVAIMIPLMLGLCASCATSPRKLPVLGSTSQLAGSWAGEFRSNDGMREGSITFSLRAGQDSAYGDVLLIARGDAQFNGSIKERAFQRPATEVLAIRFVNVSGNHVRGMLESHRDPVCGCELRTVFDGALAGDSIAGTYRTTHVQSREFRDGTWIVRRSATIAERDF